MDASLLETAFTQAIYKNLNFGDGTRKDLQVRTLKNQVITR